MKIRIEFETLEKINSNNAITKVLNILSTISIENGVITVKEVKNE